MTRPKRLTLPSSWMDRAYRKRLPHHPNFLQPRLSAVAPFRVLLMTLPTRTWAILASSKASRALHAAKWSVSAWRGSSVSSKCAAAALASLRTLLIPGSPPSLMRTRPLGRSRLRRRRQWRRLGALSISGVSVGRSLLPAPTGTYPTCGMQPHSTVFSPPGYPRRAALVMGGHIVPPSMLPVFTRPSRLLFPTASTVNFGTAPAPSCRSHASCGAALVNTQLRGRGYISKTSSPTRILQQDHPR